ncbi:MAG: 2OG-Fe(II) oxygenase [Bacteroidota bacterium]
MNFIAPEYRDLQKVAQEHHDSYVNAAPFPNIHFKNFFNENVLNDILSEFPDLEKKKQLEYKNPNENKLASKGEHSFGPKLREFMHYLNSQSFLEFLQELTNIDETLLPDPYFEGGGCHESKAGGFLKVHADFNKNRRTGLDRRLNVLIYLNKEWKDSYGGHFELWNQDMSECVTRVLPEFNTLAMFSTTDFSYHGLPDPITCPPDRSRRSLALYYYSNGRPSTELSDRGADEHTKFVDRKGNKSEAKMKRFNTMVNVITDITPPIILKTAKKVLLKSN